MRCLFCGEPSSNSRSVEHVVPESLGNDWLILPPGVVCDSCNNFFARKVEKPFLDSLTLRRLRYESGIPNKRGRVPKPQLLSAPTGGGATLAISKDGVQSVMFDQHSDLIAWLGYGRRGLWLFTHNEPPAGRDVSRFLAKMAVEYLACLDHDQRAGIGIADSELDLLRGHARYGQPREWPTILRPAYPRMTAWRRDDCSGYDRWYAAVASDEFEHCVAFVIVLFGTEFAIQLGAPDISGYRRSLLREGGRSPIEKIAWQAERRVVLPSPFRQQRVLLGYTTQ